VKYLLLVLLLVPLSLACRKSPTPAPATAARPGAPAAAAAQPPATKPTPKPMPAELPAIIAKIDGEPIERWELESAVRGFEGRTGAVPSEKRGFKTDEAFQQALAAQGFSLAQLQRQLRASMLVAKLVDKEINPKISVQDADVDTFYQQNLERFKQSETVHASHIMIGLPPNADATAKQQARAKAQAVLKQVRGGADFAKLAAEQSNDTGSAGRGGDLGFFPKGQMEPAFDAAAFAVKAGEVSGLVETSFGFHIIKVHEHRPPRTQPLTEVGGQIKEFLTGRQRDGKLIEFVEQAKAKRKVEMLV